MSKLINYISPFSYLGIKDYSVKAPLLLTFLILGLSEFFVQIVVGDPNALGSFIIFISIALVVLFSFRNGINGGLASTLVTVLYYFYIIYTRHLQGEELISGIQATLSLGFVYTILSLIIGYLKQKIDTYIDREASDKKWLQAIIDQLPVGVVIAGKDGEVIEVNKRIRKILGKDIKKGLFTPSDKTDIAKNHKQNPSDIVLNSLSQVLSGDKIIVKKEMVVKHKTENKKENYIQLTATPIISRSGQVIAVASILNDISVQKDLEKRKDDFVNIASHELKTPLTSMKLYIDSLFSKIQSRPDSKIHKIINNLKYQTDRLQEIITDLLDVSRIQTGKMIFNREIFDVGVVIKEASEDLQRSTDIHTILYKSKQPLYVYADRTRIYQVVANLLTNAIKYSPKGGEIKINLKRTGGGAVVSVKDKGIGIDQNKHKKIFERLYQVADRKEETSPGLGMGLYISKEIIKHHRGKIWVESKVGRGSTFYFSLPPGKDSYPLLTKRR